MLVWKTGIRLSNLTSNSRCLVGLSRLCLTPPLPFTKYVGNGAFYCSRSSVLKSDEKMSSKKTFNHAKSRDEFLKSSKKQMKPSQVAPSSRKLSSELEKLRFEDFSESESKWMRKDSKKEDEQFEVVFGVAPCLLALTQGRRKASCLFVKNGNGQDRDVVLKVCKEAIKRDVQIQRVSKQTLDKMCGGKVHQGLCLQASPLGFINEKRPVTSHEEKNRMPLWLVLDGVQDPMNLGAILRSAYYLGVDRIVSSIHNSCPLNPTVSKASAGVMEVVDVFGCSNLTEMLKVKVKQGWQVVGTVGLNGGNRESSVRPCSDFKISRPTLLLMGGEGDGLSPELHQLCDLLITIPPRRHLHPGIESLNVSVATGILLHSLLSSRTEN